MSRIIYHIVFLLLSLFIFIRAIAYALYEWREMKNHSGSIVIILFDVFVLIFSNIMVWSH